MKAFVAIPAVMLLGLLSACGGSGGSSSQTVSTVSASTSSVKVAGASLEDMGAFGIKFTVQGSHQVYTERVAADHNVSSFCSFFTSPDGGASWSTHTGCVNYAVAGSRVNYTSGAAVLDNVPVSIVYQLSLLASGLTSNDLLIVGEASANDAATMATDYLNDMAASTTTFATLIGTLSAGSGTDYAAKLADKQVTAIETALAAATSTPRVLVFNMLDITKTPKFKATLAQLALAYGSPTANNIQTLVQSWVAAYNTELASKVAASTYASRVAVFDLYANFNAELASPASFGLSTDTTNTVCDQTYIYSTDATHVYSAIATSSYGSTSLNTPAVVAACTNANASTLGLNVSDTLGGTTLLFSDNFHPTPYGHALLALAVQTRLAELAWN